MPKKFWAWNRSPLCYCVCHWPDAFLFLSAGADSVHRRRHFDLAGHCASEKVLNITGGLQHESCRRQEFEVLEFFPSQNV